MTVYFQDARYGPILNNPFEPLQDKFGKKINYNILLFKIHYKHIYFYRGTVRNGASKNTQ